jgi:hypothetical protein
MEASRPTGAKDSNQPRPAGSLRDFHARFNLIDYENERANFSWLKARTLLDGLPAGGVNIAHEAVDRFVRAGHGNRVAVRWLGREGAVRVLRCADLASLSSRFANALRWLDIGPRDCVPRVDGPAATWNRCRDRSPEFGRGHRAFTRR